MFERRRFGGSPPEKELHSPGHAPTVAAAETLLRWAAGDGQENISLRQLPRWRIYLDIGCTSPASMLDDALLVGIVVSTLDQHELQKHEGCWLKLISGSALLLLGATMLVAPEWLA